MNVPWLSVLIPTYNGENFLPKALDSVLHQNDQCAIECVAIDDGSTDMTQDILQSYSHRIPLSIHSVAHTGSWVHNTNFALSKAKGKYICFLHQDDLWLPNRLRILKGLTKQFPHFKLFLSPVFFIDSNNHKLGVWNCPFPKYPHFINSKLIFEKLLIQNFISIPAPIIERKICIELGGLDQSLWYTADWDLWLKIVDSENAVYYPEPLAAFRIHDNSQTNTRSIQHDFRYQLEAPFYRHWETHKSLDRSIKVMGQFSIEMNVALARIAHRQHPEYTRFFSSLVKLNPFQIGRYIRYSRIIERLSARIKSL